MALTDGRISDSPRAGVRGRLRRCAGAVVATAVAVGAAVASAPAAQALQSGDFTYRVNTSSVTVSGYTGTATDITIPSRVVSSGLTLPVLYVGRSAFSSKRLTSVVIPDTVLSLADNAFATNAFTSVTIPDSVTSVGIRSFASNSLTSLTLGEALQTISYASFAGNALTSVIIPRSVKVIEDVAFSSNPLTSVLMMGNAPTVSRADAQNPAFTPDTVVYYRADAAGFTLDNPATWSGYRAVAVGLDASLEDDQVSVAQGAHVTVSGTGAFPGATVSASMDGAAIGAGAASANGRYAFEVVVPAGFPLGSHELVLTSPFGTSTLSYSIPIVVTKGVTQVGGCAVKPFTDVKKNNPACEAITWLKSHKAATGKKFHPAKNLARLAAAKALYRVTHGGTAAPKCTPKQRKRFADAATPAKCRYALWAAMSNVIKPAAAKKFKPGAAITRAQLATALYRLRTDPTPQKCTPKKFSDVTKKKAACAAISWAVKNSIIPTSAGKTFAPKASLTRQGSAVIIYKAAPAML